MLTECVKAPHNTCVFVHLQRLYVYYCYFRSQGESVMAVSVSDRLLAALSEVLWMYVYLYQPEFVSKCQRG